MEGVGAKATGPMGTHIPLAATNLEGYEYYPEKAKALLTDAGFEGGFEAKIATDDTQLALVW